jgi:dTDP-4-amino-4,6-dideoxygalactose transaminase
MRITFNKPHLTGNEIIYIKDAIDKGHISGNGYYTKKCQKFFEEKYGFNKCLLTTSCTDALEMSALLMDIKPQDEVIVPSYTFVSSALAFAREGARIVFCDSRADHPGIDENAIEPLITNKTKAIVVVHYEQNNAIGR